MFTQKDVIAFQGYDFEITKRNGCAIERFYINSATDEIKFSEVLASYSTKTEAIERFGAYFRRRGVGISTVTF